MRNPRVHAASVAHLQELIERKTYPVPHPNVILEGCHAYKPGPLPGGLYPCDQTCPGCAGRVGPTLATSGFDPIVRYCDRCGQMGQPYDRNAAIQRELHEARVASDEARRLIEQAVREDEIDLEAEEALRIFLGEPKPSVSLFTERERRRMWNGNLKGCLRFEVPLDDLRFVTLAKIGRDFLTRIGEQPDYSLILDCRGKVRGRKGPDGTVVDDLGDFVGFIGDDGEFRKRPPEVCELADAA